MKSRCAARTLGSSSTGTSNSGPFPYRVVTTFPPISGSHWGWYGWRGDDEQHITRNANVCPESCDSLSALSRKS